MFSFNGTVTLPAGTPMTGNQLIQAALQARTYDTPEQKAAAQSQLMNSTGELLVVPTAAVMTGDAYRRVTNGVCDANFVAADLTSTIPAGAAKKISPCALSNRVFYSAAGGPVDFEFTTGNLQAGRY